nr:Dyp-type peroxidase domain-containing protein [Corynebacterium lactis]
MTETATTPLKNAIQPFDGDVQSGIMQPGPANLHLIAFNFNEDITPEGIAELFRTLTDVSRRLTQGQEIPDFLERAMVEVIANLTITAGFGERVFDLLGKSDHKPAACTIFRPSSSIACAQSGDSPTSPSRFAATMP